MCASTLALGNALLSDAIGLKLFIQTSLSKSLDPKKEVEAAELRVQGGFSTRERETTELTGTDFYKNIKQRKREEELLKEVTGSAKKEMDTANIGGKESDSDNDPDNPDNDREEEETEE